MNIQKIAALPAEIAIPSANAFSEARTVQNAAVCSAEGALRITSSGRFKRFAAPAEYIRIERGSGYIKWKRGELPFAEGDLLYAERADEYDFYGAGDFLVLTGKERA